MLQNRAISEWLPKSRGSALGARLGSEAIAVLMAPGKTTDEAGEKKSCDVEVVLEGP